MKTSRWMISVWALSLIIAISGGYALSTIILKHEPIIDRAAAQDAARLTTANDGRPAAWSPGLVETWNAFIVQASARASQLSAQEPELRAVEVQSVVMLSQLTGPESSSQTDQRWNIAGTDLGFTFMHDDRIHMVFGDTWGRDGVEGSDWRSNTMVIVEPHTDLGYVIVEAIVDDRGDAIELLSSMKEPKTEYTVIPHSGISIDGRMYLQYMSIRDWEPQGWGYFEPISNGSGFAYSDNHGRSWTKDATAYWAGNNAFTQMSIVEHGDYVYMVGTPAGRFGPAKLKRVPQAGILEPLQYEYWTGSGWRDDHNYAAEVVPAPVGELSLRWSEHHGRWLMMYLNDSTHNIVLRTAERLEGPWDEERVVVSASEYPSLYAPFMLPITGPDIHFTMSIFNPGYQVHIMKLTLE